MKYQFKRGAVVEFRPTDSERAGQVLQDRVVRRLRRDEADADVGPMYMLETNGAAFEDELSGVPLP